MKSKGKLGPADQQADMPVRCSQSVPLLDVGEIIAGLVVAAFGLVAYRWRKWRRFYWEQAIQLFNHIETNRPTYLPVIPRSSRMVEDTARPGVRLSADVPSREFVEGLQNPNHHVLLGNLWDRCIELGLVRLAHALAVYDSKLMHEADTWAEAGGWQGDVELDYHTLYPYERTVLRCLEDTRRRLMQREVPERTYETAHQELQARPLFSPARHLIWRATNVPEDRWDPRKNAELRKSRRES